VLLVATVGLVAVAVAVAVSVATPVLEVLAVLAVRVTL
jgi:hypothetical protein